MDIYAFVRKKIEIEISILCIHWITPNLCCMDLGTVAGMFLCGIMVCFCVGFHLIPHPKTPGQNKIFIFHTIFEFFYFLR